jgi:hypothetical protein
VDGPNFSIDDADSRLAINREALLAQQMQVDAIFLHPAKVDAHQWGKQLV